MKVNQNAPHLLPEKKAESMADRNPIIGYLVTETIDAYNAGIHMGLVDEAWKQGFNVVSFLGGHWRTSPTDPFAYQRNAAYNLATSKNVDGLIVNSALGNFVTEEELLSFFDKYRPLPIVSIAKNVPGVSTVLVDNDKGMREIIAHLIENHNCRRIAFIRGPEGNFEAEQRYLAYTSVLNEYRLPFDPNLVVTGDFLNASGAEAIRLLLDQRRVDFQAVVAANDGMALGAMEALQARGVRVPDDVAVVGFDDIKDAKAFTPSLTTVWQPIAEQGRQGIAKLSTLLAGEQMLEQMTLPTELVVRQSCGCLDPVVVQAAAGSVTRGSKSLDVDFSVQGERILGEMTKAMETYNKEFDPEWGKQLCDALTTELTGHSPGTFLLAINNVLYQVIAVGGDVGVMQDAVSVLRRYTLPYLDATMLWQAEDIWQQARVFIGLTIQQRQAYQSLLAERSANTLQEIAAVLAVTFDMSGLMDVLADGLPRLGIPSCYLALYEDAQTYDQNEIVPEWCRLMLAYTKSGRVKLEPGGRRFRSHELLPDDIWPQDKLFAFVMEPLYFQERQLGFVLFEVGPQNGDGRIYETLRAQLSSTLQSALLVQQVEDHARELGQAYSTLQKQQEMLLIVEKMASLGRLTAGIAHEMNTPLATVRSALSTMNELVQEYQSAIGDAEVNTDDHLEIAQEMGQIVTLATKAAERASGFVRGIKSQTRALASHDYILFDAVPVIREALLLLSHNLREQKCDAIFEPSENMIEMRGAPGKLAQVVTNLVNNAADASRSANGGPITLRLSKHPNEVELQVIDEGTGIASEVLPKIYDPMFTTKPFGQSTGLGLTIVHDIITGEFGGAIEVSSQVGKGTTFTLHFPTDSEK